MNYFYLVGGLIILLITIYDFFYTTLSGSGAFFISKSVSGLAHRLLLWLSRIFGRKIFSLSGMAVNLSVLSVWVILVWAGLLLVYSYNPEAITNSSGRPANTVERLYFTGYILSTLGVGNFKPTTAFFEVVTSIFSFFGFVFFTTAMTYLMQVTSAVMHKRSLALSINNLGPTPEKIITNLLNMGKTAAVQQLTTLQQLIDRHSVNHQAYPVLHYYTNPQKDSSLSPHMTSLFEAVTLLRGDKSNPYYNELQSLHKSLSGFLHHVREKYGISSENDRKIDLDWHASGLPSEVKNSYATPSEVYEQRKVLDSMLKSEGFEWQDVYKN